MISQRYAEANLPCQPSHDKSKDDNTLLYTDANALYAHSMIQPLPISGFKWLSAREVENFDLTKLCADESVGYLLEVDLNYPERLHDRHNCYPLAPEHLTITPTMLSPFQTTHETPCSNIRKLVPNLHDKKKYIVHSSTLALYLKLGLECPIIHRVIQFQQSPWVKEYIVFNTERRRQATLDGDAFLKDFFKLISNAFFGKTMENLRKRQNIELVQTRKIALKRIAKPNYKRHKVNIYINTRLLHISSVIY